MSAKLYEIHHCCVYGEKLLMMDRGTVRNMLSFNPKINLRNSASTWFHYKKIITTHGQMDVKFVNFNVDHLALLVLKGVSVF